MTIRTTIKTTISAYALALGLTAGLAAAAQAQTTAQTTPTPSAASPAAPAEVPAPAAQAPDKNAPGADMHHHGSKGLNAYLDALHGDLKITPAEEPLWTKFADAMRNNAAQLGEAYRTRRAALPQMTALEDMNSFIDVEQKRLDGMKRSSAAFADLYNAMPADQRKVADAVFLADMPGGPHHKGHKGPHKAEGTDKPAQ